MQGTGGSSQLVGGAAVGGAGAQPVNVALTVVITVATQSVVVIIIIIILFVRRARRRAARREQVEDVSSAFRRYLPDTALWFDSVSRQAAPSRINRLASDESSSVQSEPLSPDDELK
jgi:hypothetical protein